VADTLPHREPKNLHSAINLSSPSFCETLQTLVAESMVVCRFCWQNQRFSGGEKVLPTEESQLLKSNLKSAI